SSGVASFSAEAGLVDGSREAIHGFPLARDAALSSLRARRGARLRSDDVGVVLSTRHRARMLDERAIHHADGKSPNEVIRISPHARARHRRRILFHWRQ